MRKLQLNAFKDHLFGCFRANPVETILGLCFFILFVVAENSTNTTAMYWQALLPFMFPTLFVVAYSFNYFFEGKKRPLYYLSLLTLLPLCVFSGELKGFLESPAYAFTLLLTSFMLFAHRRTPDNASFAYHCIRLVVDLLFAAIIGLVLLGTILAIYYTIIYIFNIKNDGQFIFYVSYFICYLFVPLLFSQVQRLGAKWETLPKMVQFVLNYILSPAIIIYTGILYVYFITIIFNWELPKGGVANMVIAFIIIALGNRMFQLIVNQKYYEWFYRNFSVIAIPPLLLFWIASIERICTYHFTEYRVYLLAAGVLMTLFVFLLYSKRFGSYRLMLLLSAGVIVLLTYIPGISARSIGIVAQSQRMEELARELSLWDEATGKLTGTESFQTKDSVQAVRVGQLNACYDFLVSQRGQEKIESRYGENHIQTVTKEVRTVLFSRPESNIPIEGYKYFLSDCNISVAGDTLQLLQADSMLCKIDIKQHFGQYKEAMDLWKEKAEGLDPFFVQDDRYMVVIGHIRRDEKGDYTFGTHRDVFVFSK